jgi:hypothetical protein
MCGAIIYFSKFWILTIIPIFCIGFDDVKMTLQPQIRLVDKVSSLAMYGLAASSIAEVVGLALGSLLAVGGVSGKHAWPLPTLSIYYTFKAPWPWVS